MFSDARSPDILGYPPQDVDPALRAYMLRVYDLMAGGLGVSGVTSYLAISTDLYHELAATPFIWLIVLAPLGVVFFLSIRIGTMRPAAAQLAFWIYAVLMGLSLSGVFLAYSDVAIAKAFLAAAGTFSATSLYGYATARDLTRLGSFLFMGLVGFILAGFISLLFASSILETAISLVGVILFAALTAYDTQRIKSVYLERAQSEAISNKALIGALTLYLDFINLFLMMLRFTRDRRE
ncbi:MULTISPECIES: Bax inhibitor-1/YccA family protein [unclassified Mesorhizobium]|uniref:Bax inhibitor-1/YccA family protein n=3 Tax=Mesorhizobium TaxID=68287 RepID=UPI000FE9A106|nr:MULTISPECIES: Bax inhibitor-1/YccA family protein [unclassified Mesorhizobium]MDG4887876.1 Bax inhibitor-1/YccA family protein [Mesorhizobium sp. WSM4887]RWK87115.1 MAG: Bax inhibitor-1/YccA family protein [Mesorhizobium sp.]TIP16630.1 MAG: Bax inhibitor-1/YccA family protein [Mesorhizobium sp.]TIQ07640.1 MAG: Bax inhibitor-1/YccA family protein [Mesorhizobium sp.]TJV82857.1 MAG: Bax inhibitor-1/YccA family protein [Mesorhizobium sp.]